MSVMDPSVFWLSAPKNSKIIFKQTVLLRKKTWRFDKKPIESLNNTLLDKGIELFTTLKILRLGV